jgi:hypothetical protein
MIAIYQGVTVIHNHLRNFCANNNETEEAQKNFEFWNEDGVPFRDIAP